MAMAEEAEATNSSWYLVLSSMYTQGQTRRRGTCSNYRKPELGPTQIQGLLEWSGDNDDGQQSADTGVDSGQWTVDSNWVEWHGQWVPRDVNFFSHQRVIQLPRYRGESVGIVKTALCQLCSVSTETDLVEDIRASGLRAPLTGLPLSRPCPGICCHRSAPQTCAACRPLGKPAPNFAVPLSKPCTVPSSACDTQWTLWKPPHASLEALKLQRAVTM